MIDMKTINSQQLEKVINDYVNSSLINSPLLVAFGKYEESIALHIIKGIFGNANSFKIGSIYDSPNSDMPYVVYDTYNGDNNSITILKHCASIAQSIHKPVFCFISTDHLNKMPEGVISSDFIYSYKE